MQITAEFNRLYHGAFLKDLYDQMVSKRRIIISFLFFKEALKYANPNYPRYENTNDLVSTKDINSKDLVDHLEWIRLYAGEYGFTLTIDDQEWSRMMELAHA